jgi:hypothetical protein
MFFFSLSYGFSTLFLCTVYRRHGDEERSSVYQPRDGRLAREPDVQLDKELSVNQLDVRAGVIGNQIVLVLVDLRIHNPDSDAIYLMDRKHGRMMPVSRASCMQHAMGAGRTTRYGTTKRMVMI